MPVMVNPFAFGGGFPANAVTFDGTNDYLLGAASSPYFADSKLFSASFWFRATDTTKTCILLYASAGGRVIYVQVAATGNGTIEVVGNNSSGTNVISMSAEAASDLYDGEFHHLAFSFDLSDSSNRTVKIDNGNPSSTTWTTFTNGNINFQMARTAMSVGHNTSAAGSTNIFAGDLAEVYIAPGKNLRFDQTSSLRKFITASGKPVQRSANGGYNGADIPDIWLSGATDAWHTNKGNAGGFTEFGALTTSASLPVEL